MSGQFELSSIDSFGDVAAEDDAVLDYFLATNAVQRIEGGQASLVLGRKGTGKTAIVRYFTERADGTLSRPLNLRGCPWNVHALRIDLGASDIEAYVASWKYLIAVELAALVVKDPRSAASLQLPAVKKFLNDNYGGTQPNLVDILRPKSLKLGKFSLAPQLFGNALGSIDLDRTGSDHQLGLELNALTKSIMDAVFDIVRVGKLGRLSLHFDELDRGLSALDDSTKRMLIGLILAVREVRRDSDKAQVSINPVIYLRTDLWEELQFSDKNKIDQTLTLHLAWNNESLQSMVEARLKSKSVYAK